MRLLFSVPGPPFVTREAPLAYGGDGLLPLSRLVESIDRAFGVDGDG